MSSQYDPSANDYSIELNLTGTSLDPDRITAILGCQPTSASRPGEPAPCRLNAMIAPGNHGYWAFETSLHDTINQCCDHQLMHVLNLVEPNMPELLASGVERVFLYYTLSSFTGLMNIRFSAKTLARIASMSADLYVTCFDCYDPSHPYWSEGDATTDNAAGNPPNGLLQ